VARIIGATGTSHTVAEDAFHFTTTISDDVLTHIILEGQDRVKKVVSHATGLSKDTATFITDTTTLSDFDNVARIIGATGTSHTVAEDAFHSP